MPKLTASQVERLPVKDKRYVVCDDSLRGFEVRVNTNGSKTAVVRYFHEGRVRRMSLGRLGEHFTFAQARNEAKRYLGDAARGKDPARERRQRRDAPCLAEVAERFMAEHAEPYRKPSTVYSYRQLLRRHLLPALGSTRVQDIERGDVERLHQRIGKKTPGSANRVVQLLSSILGKAEVWGYRPLRSNPCYKMEKFPGRKVERFLTGEERARLEEVLDESERARPGHPYYVSPGVVPAIRLLAMTGARCGEIVGLQRSMVDFERRLLNLPDSKTGAKIVPLSGPALVLLRQLEQARRSGVQWVCPNEAGGALENIGRAWRGLRKRAGLEDVRLHDLRHSAASDALAAGLSLPLIGAMLGHKSPLTTKRYAHLGDQVRQQAAEVMGEAIEASKQRGVEALRMRRAVGDGGRDESADVRRAGQDNVIRLPLRGQR